MNNEAPRKPIDQIDGNSNTTSVSFDKSNDGRRRTEFDTKPMVVDNTEVVNALKDELKLRDVLFIIIRILVRSF